MEFKSLVRILEDMSTDKISNYVIAGLDSSLLGNGCVRYFENSRDHQDQITPHSHRFDFCCLVLNGKVENTIWTTPDNEDSDEFVVSELSYCGEVGVHDVENLRTQRYAPQSSSYYTGDVYQMLHSEIHSIKFSRVQRYCFLKGLR